MDSYNIEDGGHYLIIGDVSGAPGETVKVPVYVYGDPGTAGLHVFFESEGAKITKMRTPSQNYAYPVEPIMTPEANPKTLVFATDQNMVAPDGSVLVELRVTIPEDAAEGKVYPIKFYRDEFTDDDGRHWQILLCNRDRETLKTAFYDGTVTAVKDKKTALNYTDYNLPTVKDTVNLTLFNALGEVKWTSSDPSIATVDQNGFVKAVARGTTIITAENNGTKYQCSIMVGLYGDVNGNGEVTAEDSQLTLMEYIYTLAHKPSLLTDAQKMIANVSGDTDADGNPIITSDDAQYILIYYIKQLAHVPDLTWYSVTGNPKSPGAPV